MANANAGHRTWIEPRQHELPEPHGATVEDALSPPRSMQTRERATDLMKTTVPLPSMAGLIICALAIAAVMWRLESRLDLINERIAHNKELIDLREKALEDRFKMLEAKIEAAGLRNSAMILSQELAKKNAER